MGHGADVPVHVSCTSHTPPACLHTVPTGKKAFAGQSRPPAQVSFASQGPATDRHNVPRVWNRSTPQLLDTPSHRSNASHSPLADRHTVEVVSIKSAGQSTLVPGHISARSHAPDAGRHTTAAELATNLHFCESQHDGHRPVMRFLSHCSPPRVSITPLPQRAACTMTPSKQGAVQQVVTRSKPMLDWNCRRRPNGTHGM